MRVGFATIGQSPRDDVVPYLREQLGPKIQVFEGGALDGLDDDEIAALDDNGPGVHMVTRLRDGRKVRLAYDRVLPRIQMVVDSLEADGAEVVVILCGADWSPVICSVPVVNLGKLFPGVIQALSGGKLLGVVKPDAGQIQRTIEQFHGLGTDAFATSASPYDGDRLQQADAAGEQLASANVDLVWMSCVGMDEEMRGRIAAKTGKVVVLARTLLAGTLKALIADIAPPNQSLDGVYSAPSGLKEKK